MVRSDQTSWRISYMYGRGREKVKSRTNIYITGGTAQRFHAVGDSASES